MFRSVGLVGDSPREREASRSPARVNCAPLELFPSFRSAQPLGSEARRVTGPGVGPVTSNETFPSWSTGSVKLSPSGTSTPNARSPAVVGKSVATSAVKDWVSLPFAEAVVGDSPVTPTS